jgi:hypothetical protein
MKETPTTTTTTTTGTAGEQGGQNALPAETTAPLIGKVSADAPSGPGPMSCAFVWEDLTETEAMVIEALRKGREIETDWKAYHEKEARYFLEALVHTLRGGETPKPDTYQIIEPLYPLFLHAAGAYAAAIDAFVADFLRQQDAERKTGGETGQETEQEARQEKRGGTPTPPAPIGESVWNMDLSDTETDLILAARTGEWPLLQWDDPAYIADAQADGVTLDRLRAERAEYMGYREILLANLRRALPPAPEA